VNVSADQVRAATRAAAAVITADKVPPLRLKESPASHRRARRSRRRRPWIAPLATVAAVAVVAVVSVVAAKSGSGHASNPSVSRSSVSKPKVSKQAAPVGSYISVPPYYVAVESSSLAAVRATETGATLARITTSTPVVGVAGAADDRSFVLDAQSSIVGGTVQWVGQPAYYLLRLTASGGEQSYTRLSIPALPAGFVVAGLALSPDGSQLAIAADSGDISQSARLEISVYTLATGASHTWSATGIFDSQAPFGFTGSGARGAQSISWGADSTTLAFDWENASRIVGVRLLDTAANGDDLIADSRVAATEPSPISMYQQERDGDVVYSCMWNWILSLDGSGTVCDYEMGSKDSNETTSGFLWYSTSTGKLTVISTFQTDEEGPGGDNALYWVNSTGRTVIGEVGPVGGDQVGVITGDKFTPLPGITNPGAAAW
jgi:hypothetical protein